MCDRVQGKTKMTVSKTSGRMQTKVHLYPFELQPICMEVSYKVQL